MNAPTTIIPVILSGGSGTRLWPMSTPEKPKQLLALTADETMLQLTAQRTAGRGVRARRSSSPTRAMPTRSRRNWPASDSAEHTLILEPVARNTAPAIALAALAAGEDATLLVMPSDHVIADTPAFHAAIQAALPMVEQGWLVTFGIDPHAPETGYGWIHVGEAIAPRVHRVASFVEKPPRDRAEAMLAAGDHVWNGGIFLFRADAFLGALAAHAPDMLHAAQQALLKARHARAREFIPTPTPSPPRRRIDRLCGDGKGRARRGGAGQHGVERPRQLGCAARTQRRATITAMPCKGDVVAIETENCLVQADGVRVALVGVTDLIVVANGKDVLVMPRGRSQEVKKLIEAMKD